MNLFVDECLGNQVAEAVKAAGHRVVRLADVNLPPDTDDEDIARLCHDMGLLWLTKDLGKTDPLPYEAIHDLKLRVFCLRPGNLKGPEQAAVVVGALSSVGRLAQRRDPPFIARIYKNSSVRIWRRGDEILQLL